MEIRVSDVKKWAGREETLHIESRDFEDAQQRLDFPFLSPLSLDVKVRNTGHELLVECEGTVKVQAICSRCLEPFVLEIPFEIFEEFHEEAGPDDPSLDYHRFLGDKIGLDVLVADAVAVSVPMAPVCSADCRGLCPQCGANLNLHPCDCITPADDRWGPLREWAESHPTARQEKD